MDVLGVFSGGLPGPMGHTGLFLEPSRCPHWSRYVLRRSFVRPPVGSDMVTSTKSEVLDVCSIQARSVLGPIRPLLAKVGLETYMHSLPISCYFHDPWIEDPLFCR